MLNVWVNLWIKCGGRATIDQSDSFYFYRPRKTDEIRSIYTAIGFSAICCHLSCKRLLEYVMTPKTCPKRPINADLDWIGESFPKRSKIVPFLSAAATGKKFLSRKSVWKQFIDKFLKNHQKSSRIINQMSLEEERLRSMLVIHQYDHSTR